MGVSEGLGQVEEGASGDFINGVFEMKEANRQRSDLNLFLMVVLYLHHSRMLQNQSGFPI